MKSIAYEPAENARLDATFGALADATRRAILARLARGEATVLELAEPFAMSQPAISKHLKVLERAGLVARTRQAQSRPSRLQAAPLAVASAWLERYREQWEESFQKLDGVLAELQGSPRTRGKASSPHRRSRIGKRKDQP